VPKWIKINLGQEFEAGTYQVKLEGQKDPSETIDWQIKSNGFWTEEWAIWGAVGGLVSYYKLDETSGTVAEDELNVLNMSMTGSGDWVEGKIENSFYSSEAGEYLNATRNLTQTWTISLWTKIPLTDAPRDINNHLFTIRIYANNTIGFQLETPNWQAFYTNETFTDNTWEHIVIQFDNNDNVGKLYLNGEIVLSETYSDGYVAELAETQFPRYLHGGILIDEIGIWNRTLTSNEISELYNSGDGLPYGTEAGFVLNSPANNYVSSNAEVKFNCSYDTRSALTITNMSLWTNETGSWELGNVTTGLSGTTNTEVWNRTFSDTDTILWTCRACESDNSCSFPVVNRTLSIDTSPPSINVETPSGTLDYGIVGNNETLNVTFTDINLDSCWYNYNGTNITIDGCQTGTSNSTNFTLEIGNTNMTVWANDGAEIITQVLLIGI